jgi:tripartite-type tricarboxylate transporter receptor subunit TctC
MRNSRRQFLAAAFAAPFLARSAAAQGKYPERPIKIIVPFPPGGGVDLTARLMMEPLSKELGQTIVIENKGGAGGIIGVEAMSHSPPDGYTLSLTGAGTLTAGPHLRTKMPYDPQALAQITRLVRMPFIIAVRNELPAKTLPEFMELAKRQELRWASGGIGTSQHLAGELFTQMSGLKMVHVPYRGTGPALNDLAAGIVDAYFGDPATLGLIRSGKARAMAVTSPERWPVLPDTPAMAEAVKGIRGGELVRPRGPSRHAQADRRPAQRRRRQGAGRARREEEVRRERPYPSRAFPGRLRGLPEARLRHVGRRGAQGQHQARRIMSARLAVDIGGTFTDVVLETGTAAHATKILTTPDAPERAVLEGVRAILAEAKCRPGDVGLVVHGTTLATNALIERKGAHARRW